jgi:peptidyl-prolyl cis-trans isomerase SurA
MHRRFLFLIAATLPVVMAADVRIVEEIAAKVNGDIITRGELEDQRREIEQQLRAEGLSGAKLAEAVKQAAANALRDQIDQLLLVQRAKDLNINVDGEVTRELADMQVRSKISDPDKFHQLIQEQYGMPFEDFRDRMKRQFLAQRVIGQEVGSRVTIPEADLRKYYEDHKSEFVRKEQVFLSQILIFTEGKTPEQVAAAEKKAKDIVARARKGEKFSDLVRDNSDDTETARNGGALPPMQPDQLQPQISAIVFKQNKGYVTDPIRVPQGFVILRVDDRYEAGQASFEEVKNEIQDKLMRPQMEPKIREYLTRLRMQAFLEIKEGYVDSGAAPGKDTRWQDVAQLKPQTTTKEEVASRGGKHKRLFVIPIPFTSSTPPAVAPDTSGAAPTKTEEPPVKP